VVTIAAQRLAACNTRLLLLTRDITSFALKLTVARVSLEQDCGFILLVCFIEISRREWTWLAHWNRTPFFWNSTQARRPSPAKTASRRRSHALAARARLLPLHEIQIKPRSTPRVASARLFKFCVLHSGSLTWLAVCVSVLCARFLFLAQIAFYLSAQIACPAHVLLEVIDIGSATAPCYALLALGYAIAIIGFLSSPYLIWSKSLDFLAFLAYIPIAVVVWF